MSFFLIDININIHFIAFPFPFHIDKRNVTAISIHSGGPLTCVPLMWS